MAVISLLTIASTWKPLLRVLSALFTEFAAALFIGGFLSWRVPILLLMLFLCSTFTAVIAFLIEWILDSFLTQ